ncbi:hypothetical protein DL96DRAFT_1621787 [Flagelloscypha sp. PMI_526]|nr:hypothetical protein DL96DRAFT_1621787 [Flagelloscypha sp. PMI_526]
MSRLSKLGFYALAAAALCSAKVFNSFAEVPNPGGYDYVIVGAGPGGSTVANRLTEIPSVKVLLIEAGGANNDDLTNQIPLFCTHLTPHTRYDWNYSSIPQTGLDGRVVPFPTGIGLGGSTNVNCLVYTRGSKDDIDHWGVLSGEDGWGWDSMLDYYKKSEFWNEPRDGHDTTDEYEPEFHGKDGYIGVSLPGESRFIDGPIIETTKQLDEFPYQQDQNDGEQLGISWVQALVKNGARSSAKEYLVVANGTRKNFDILLNSKVSRVLASEHDKKRFSTVEFAYKNGFKTITARKELILSAGAVNTPNILLHSGIGDPKELDPLRIPVLHNLPSVGKNLTDHVGVSTTMIINTTNTWDSIQRNQTALNALIEEWKANKTGLLTTTSENLHAWLRIPDDSSIWDDYEDPTPGPSTAHYEWLFQDGLAALTEQGNYMNLPTACVSPASRGNITINSTDVFAPPLVNPNLLAEKIDLIIVRESIKAVRRFIAAPAWDGIIIGSLNNNATTDEELDAFVKQNAVSFFHPIGTSAMSPLGAHYGVVDPDLKVKGLKGLRIVDAGVAPSLPAAHTSAIVYGIAERAADIIKLQAGLI